VAGCRWAVSEVYHPFITKPTYWQLVTEPLPTVPKIKQAPRLSYESRDAWAALPQELLR